MNSSNLKQILVYCVKRYKDEMNLLYGCLDSKRRDLARYDIMLKEESVSDLFLLVLDTYATSGLAFIGIIINVLGCCQLLSRSERQKMFSLVLLSILVFDILYLAFKLMRSLEHFLPVADQDFWLYYTIADAGGRFALTGTILMMVAIARIRYRAIKTPLQQRTLLSSRNKRILELLKYLIPTIILSLASTSPLFYEIYDASRQPVAGSLLPSHSNVIGMSFDPLYCFFVLGLWNFVLLGIIPVAYLIHFSYQIIVTTNKRRLQNRQVSYVVRSMNEASEKITKSLVGIIIVFIVLHSPRILASVGEYYYTIQEYKLTMPNRNEKAPQFGYGIPMWLQVLGPVNELCTVLNACLNILIYRYLKCTCTCPCCPTWIPSYFRRTLPTATSPSVSRAHTHRATTPIEEHESRNLSENTMNVVDVNPLSIANKGRVHFRKEDNESRKSFYDAINMESVNEIITFKVRKIGHDYV